jgi:hypothetical protein
MMTEERIGGSDQTQSSERKTRFQSRRMKVETRAEAQMQVEGIMGLGTFPLPLDIKNPNTLIRRTVGSPVRTRQGTSSIKANKEEASSTHLITTTPPLKDRKTQTSPRVFEQSPVKRTRRNTQQRN